MAKSNMKYARVYFDDQIEYEICKKSLFLVSCSHSARLHTRVAHVCWRQVSSLQIYKCFWPLCGEAGMAVGDASRQLCINTHQPVCTSKQQSPSNPPAQQPNLLKGEFQDSSSFRVIFLLQRETWKLNLSVTLLCFTLSKSSGCLICCPTLVLED